MTIFIKRTHALVFLHPMFMPLAVSPLAMSPNLHRVLHPGLYNSTQITESSNPTSPGLMTTPLPGYHTARTWRTTASSTPYLSSSVEIPTYLGSSVEVPTYLPVLLAIGTLLTVMTGAAAMMYCFLRRRLTPPSPPAYEILDEDHDSHENQMKIILSKAVHVRTPLERLAVNRWAEQQNSN